MSIMVVDGLGGGIGTQIITFLRQRLPEEEIVAVGTNAVASSSMIKAGASRGATGENSIRVCLRDARCIIGPIGIVIPDSMWGEITSGIATIIAGASIPKILIPVNHKNIEIVGVGQEITLSELIKDAVCKAMKLIK